MVGAYKCACCCSFELRQANRIARAQAVMELSAAHNVLNSTRFANSEFAQLHSLMHDPDHREISEVDAWKITGVAYYLHNTLWSAQSAYDNGILSIDDLANYRNDLNVVLEEMPGLIPDLLYIYETQVGKQDAYVFEPLAELGAKRQEELHSD
jgi:hypothetical protein